MQPLVSILIPAYNAERWISETVASALQQTWDRKEVIIVDDGSRDNTLEIARRLASRVVSVVAQNNGGACAARNKALSLAQGEYIQWLDADDLLVPDKIELQLKQMGAERDPLLLLTSAWGRFYFRPERAVLRPDSLWADLQPVDWFLRKFGDGSWMNPGAWLVSRRLADLAGPWDDRLSFSGDDDGEYLCRLVANSHGVKFTRDAVARYRIGNTSGLSWRKSDKALEAFFLATTLCIDHLRRLEDSDRSRVACLKFLQARLRYFEPFNGGVVEAAHKLAAELGGTLSSPSPSRQFQLMSHVIGWKMAMKMKSAAWSGEVSLHKNWDRAFYLLQKRNRPSR